MMRTMTDLGASDSQPHVVIGGGFGGLTAAQALKQAPVRVTLIDRSNHHLFQPLLYQVATAALSPSAIASPIRFILRGQKNVRVLLAEVTDIDLDTRMIKMREGKPAEMTYDYLILATGVQTNYFGNDAWAQYALEIRRRVLLAFEEAECESTMARRERLLTFVAIGGGPTGVEMAGALAELARFALAHDFRAINPQETSIVLIEMSDRILSTFSPDLSDPGHAEAFAIGDTAAFLHQGGKPLPGVSPVAIQQARYTARIIMRAVRGQPRHETFRYVDKGNMATIGRSRAIAEMGRLKLSGFLAWWAWLVVHLFFLIGFRNRLSVLFDWTYSYLTYQRGERLITAGRRTSEAPGAVAAAEKGSDR